MKVTLGKYKKNGARRNLKVQIDKWDTWSLDHTLALIIHPALIKYKEDSSGTGYPCLDKNCFGIDMEELHGKCNCEAIWNEIVDKMIWSFGEVLNDDIQSHSTEEYHEYRKKVQEGLELFGKYFQTLWT